MTFSLATGIAQAGAADTVHFPSADGAMTLTGYVFMPAGPGLHTAVVMSHGRADPYSSLLIAVAENDEEVSPTVFRIFAETLQGRATPLEFVWYDGAHHAYDDPGNTKQSHVPNQLALRDTLQRAEAFFARHLRH